MAHSELEARVWDELAQLRDPEIPAISLVDLGVIGEVRYSEGGERLNVSILPTFIACPAIGVMQRLIGERLRAIEAAPVIEVRTVFDPPWSAERITSAGRAALRAAGFAPPVLDGDDLLPVAECPYCSSRNTTLDNPFGPTLCRAIYHCDDCNQPFEQFKRV